MESLLGDTFDLPTLEADVLALWKEHDVVARVAASRVGGERWVTFEGPPTVNGSPALHHVFTSVYKDVYARFQVLRGKHVVRKGGWDCQGLPIEIAVERELGLGSKHDIEAHGVEAFTDACRAMADRNIAAFEQVLERVGYWVDFDEAYRTMDDTFLESVWWQLGQMHSQDLLYEGAKVVPYCTRCGTALSSHELGQPGVYRDVTDLSAYVALPLDDTPSRNLVVWTTTPWTLPANVAVAVHPDFEYGIFRRAGDSDGEREYLVLPERAIAVFGGELDELGVTQHGTVRGSELAGLSYTRPFPHVVVEEGAAQGAGDRIGVVVAWPDTAADAGSGMIHIAPAFGDEDNRLGQLERLALVNPVGPDGRYTEAFAEHAGSSVHETSPAIVEELRTRGLLVREEGYEHSYPHCWRCSQPLVYWAKPAWYIRTSAVKERFLEENAKVEWHPATIKDGRFGNWLRDNVDWALSRDRYWGTPLPVWRCEEGHDTFISSRAELEQLAGRDLADLVSLHRPHIDAVTITCPDPGCGREARRLEPVVDVWLDSGAMPTAQWGAPLHGEQQFRENFPADFICEAIDQTRGWFYSLLAVNTIVHGATPYRNVVCLGLLVDDDGRKMSKSVGNVIDPHDLLPVHGADGVRWFLMGGGAPWGPRRVSVDAIGASVRRDLDTLRNVTAFWNTYATIAGFSPRRDVAPSTHVADQWLASRTQALVDAVAEHMEGYRAHLAVEAMAAFIDELSNWYVRVGRRRFWGGDEGRGEAADPGALETLHASLRTLSVVMAPIVPFVAEALFQVTRHADDPDSVHLADFPATGAERDAALEAEMAAARTAASVSRALRAAARIPARQPLRRAAVAAPAGAALREEVQALLRSEMNVHELSLLNEGERKVEYRVDPNWGVLGPRFRDRMGDLKTAIAQLPASAGATIAAGGAVTIDLGGDQVELTGESLKVVEIPQTGWASQEEDGTYVALDTEIDAELEAEGRVRTLIRRIQVARRESGLEVTDRIDLWLGAAGLQHGDTVAREVLATSVSDIAELTSDTTATRDETGDFALRVAAAARG